MPTDTISLSPRLRSAALASLPPAVLRSGATSVPSRVRIRTLGPTLVLRDGIDIGGTWLEQRAGEVLEILVCRRGRVVSADELIEALWPGGGPGALASLRFAVHALRDRLDGAGRPKRGLGSLVVSHRNGYRLDGDRVEVDADRFASDVERGLIALRHGRDAVAHVQLAGAISCYGGDFLADAPYAEWAFGERERLRGVAAEALSTLARLAELRGDLAAAARALGQLAELEPYDEAIHRDLVRLCLVRGRRSEAMRRYDVVAARLRRDLQHEPDFSIASLLDELRSA